MPCSERSGCEYVFACGLWILVAGTTGVGSGAQLSSLEIDGKVVCPGLLAAMPLVDDDEGTAKSGAVLAMPGSEVLGLGAIIGEAPLTGAAAALPLSSTVIPGADAAEMYGEVSTGRLGVLLCRAAVMALMSSMARLSPLLELLDELLPLSSADGRFALDSRAASRFSSCCM